MLSRLRLAGVSIAVGIGLLGALFFGLLHSHHLKGILEATLGPHSDALSGVALVNPDPEVWQQIATRHAVTILVEPAGGEAVAFNTEGERIASPPTFGRLRAVRTGADGTRVTLFYPLWSFKESHVPFLAALFFLVTLIVGSGFWFLQRQLKPLAWLHGGVDAVARGDFATRVPVVRRDEIGQVAEAFNTMASRVGEMISDRERLLADVSHELRSPIGRMKVALEFLPEGDKRDALARDLREMERLIAALLEREELRSRAGRLAGEEVDLSAIAREVSTGFLERGPGVRFDSNGAVRIRADPALMRLLLQNLLDNAVKFSRPDSAPVAAALESTADQVVLRIADDGIGIPETGVDKLFEPFVKLDPARGHGVGYGVGLNLCRRIVQLHGGTIRLVARQPRGTEAIVTLPRP